MRVLVVGVCLFLQSCLTFSGSKLAEIEPPAAGSSHTFETGFRDFNFQLDGGAMVSSASVAFDLNKELMRRWVKQGYASSYQQRGREELTGSFDYSLTLGGNLDGESSVFLQVLSGLTLFLIPHTIDSHAYLSYELKRSSDGKVFNASVSEDVHQITWLPLILGLPWMGAGAAHAYDKAFYHLYKQFAEQGAFK